MRARKHLELMALISTLLAAGCSDTPKGGDAAPPREAAPPGEGKAPGEGKLPGEGAPPTKAVTITQSGKLVAPGSTYCITMNTCTTTVALFSEQRELFTIKNVSTATVTLSSAKLAVATGVAAEEYGLQTADVKPAPLDLKDAPLAAGATKDFYVRFYPVAGGARTATFTLTFNTSESYSFTVSGNGQTKAAFFSGGTVDWTKIYGGPKSDELTGAMVADSQGNVYFSANVTEVVDKFSSDILIGRINAAGTLAWAKVWNGQFKDYSPDPGQNAESGGGAHSLALDSEGNLYLAGARSISNANSLFQALVLKINPTSGAILWEKVFSPVAGTPSLAKHNAQAYALDASGKYVYVTGTTGSNTDNGEAHVLLLALSKSDGSIYFKKSFEVHATYNDRGYCVRPDGKGSAFIGGNGSGNAILLKVGDVETTSPKVFWAKKVDLGTGGNINSLDVDSAGNAYLALDRRGATTYLSVAKVDGNGSLQWGKTYDGGSPSDSSNVHVVRATGADVLLGGRIAISSFDTQMGDGLVARLKGADGALAWAAFHFSGKGPDELAEHRVKGIALSGSTLYLGVQAYTGTYNGVRYSGYWYDGLGTLSDYSPTISASSAPATIIDLATGAVTDAAGLRQYVDAPAALVFQDATAKKDGTPPDADFFLSKVTLK